jgi:hypothetical protein
MGKHFRGKTMSFEHLQKVTESVWFLRNKLRLVNIHGNKIHKLEIFTDFPTLLFSRKMWIKVHNKWNTVRSLKGHAADDSWLLIWNQQVRIQKPVVTYDVVTYDKKAVCPDLFAMLPNVFHHINFTIFIEHCRCNFCSGNTTFEIITYWKIVLETYIN